MVTNNLETTTPKLMFREEALAHFATPKETHKLIAIIKPFTWVVLAVLGFISFSVLIWSITGAIPVTLQSQGILIPEQGVFITVTAPDGVNTVQTMSINQGDFLQSDQNIAVLNNPELMENISTRKRYVQDLKEKLASLQKEAAESIKSKEDMNKRQQLIIKEQLSNKERQESSIADYLVKKKELFKKGYSTVPDLLQLENQINSIKQEASRLKEQLIQLEQDERSTHEMWRQKEREIEIKLRDEQRDFENLVAKLETTTAIKTPRNGRVINIHKKVGDKVLVNDPIVTLSHGSNDHSEALIYVNSAEGGDIKEGMTVYIAPTYLEKEQFGYIIGKVIQVSTYPETSRSLMSTLQNEDLVKKFSEGAPPISVRVKLEKDLESPSKLSWTTGKGPDVDILPGTLIRGRIVVKNLLPIELLIPKLKKLLGFM
jgi:HlyD family secretion protein